MSGLWNVLLATALVQGGEPAAPADDYRARVFLAYTFVFVCIIVYLLQSHRKNRRLDQDLEVLDRRIRELEGKQP
jgi:hypothetical protein